MPEENTEQKRAFYKALAEVQGKLQGAKKDSKNPHFKNRYADLESVWEAWTTVGPAAGFSIIQKVRDAGQRQGVVVETVLAHAEGHSESTDTYVPAPKGDAQGYGSAITYGRRYSLAAMVGIVQTDDDGEAARKAHDPPPDLSAFKKFTDDAYKAKDLAGLETLLTNPVAQEHPRVANYIQAAIAKLKENK